jgi:hypothetical protein
VVPAEGRILVAAHHGVCDGLGLVALGGLLAGRSTSSLARGIGDRSASEGFARRSARRLVEAARRPPPRFPSRSAGQVAAHVPDHLRVAELPACAGGTADLVAAVLRAFEERGGHGDPLLFVGASRRPAGRPSPDRRTAYLRLRAAAGSAPSDVADALARTAPEPDFPETSWLGVGPLATRVLRDRLGATATISNLGVLKGDGLRSAAMFAASNGPRAVVVGLATAGETTSVPLRTRASDYSVEETDEILDLVATGYRTFSEARRG